MAESRRRRSLLRWLAASIALLAVVAAVAVAVVWTTLPAGPAERALTSAECPACRPTRVRHTRPRHRIPTCLRTYRCYCGCGLLKEPHASLERCFLLPDGSFEAHASGCGTCTDIALDALAMEAQGLEHADIRTRVDEKYARAGPPTDTPLP